MVVDGRWALGARATLVAVVVAGVLTEAAAGKNPGEVQLSPAAAFEVAKRHHPQYGRGGRHSGVVAGSGSPVFAAIAQRCSSARAGGALGSWWRRTRRLLLAMRTACGG